MIDKKPYADYIVTQWLLDSQPIVDLFLNKACQCMLELLGP